MEVQREVLWTVDQVRRDAGATFPRSTCPVQPWPFFFSAAEERSCRPSSNHQLSYIFPSCCPALTLATMLLAEQIGSWSPPPSGPCRKSHLHMAMPRRVGLAGSLAHDNAEWSSALLGHAGIRNRICRIIHLRARGVSRRGGIGPEALEARGSGQQH